MRVAVIHNVIDEDAASDELDNLVQVGAVSEALNKLGHETVEIALELDLEQVLSDLNESGCSAAFNLVETVAGSGRFLYLGGTLCDLARVRYTGCRTEALLTTTDKVLTKQILASAGIPTAPWIDPRCSESRLTEGDAVIVKPVYEDASVGLDDTAVLRGLSPAQILDELRKRAERFGFAWFAERFVDGREFNISIFGNAQCPKVLPPAEIRFLDFPADKPRFVGYAAKWEEQSFEYLNTKRSFDFSASDSTLLSALSDLTKRCWKELQLSGYARVDYRIDEFGAPWVLEVNANPCISPDSGFIAAAAEAGLSYIEVVKEIVECANEPV